MASYAGRAGKYFRDARLLPKCHNRDARQPGGGRSGHSETDYGNRKDQVRRRRYRSNDARSIENADVADTMSQPDDMAAAARPEHRRTDLGPAQALDLLMMTATLLFTNGQTTERTTEYVERLAKALGF